MRASTKRHILNTITAYVIITSIIFTGWLLWTIPKVALITWGHVTSWAGALKGLVPLS